MKIGLVLDTTLDSDAGVQQYFKGLARFLISKGHHIKFLVPPSQNNKEFKDRIVSFGKEIVLKGNANTVRTVIFTRKSKIRRVLKKEQFDVLNIAAPFSPFLGAKILREANCPIVSTYLVYGKSFFNRIGGLFLKIVLGGVYRRIDSFIAVSDAAEREARVVIPGDYKLIPIGINLDKYNEGVESIRKYSNDGMKNIVSLGRFEKRKGQIYLVRAFKKVKKVVKNARLILIGDGPEKKKIKKAIDNLALDDVVLTGYIPERLKSNYYASADLCVFPSLYGESFGVVLIEAMASGKATVTYANKGYRYVLRDIPDLLVENKNIDKLAEKIIDLLQDDKLRKECENRCLQEVKKFSWKNVGEEILKEYRRVIT